MFIPPLDMTDACVHGAYRSTAKIVVVTTKTFARISTQLSKNPISDDQKFIHCSHNGDMSLRISDATLDIFHILSAHRSSFLLAARHSGATR